MKSNLRIATLLAASAIAPMAFGEGPVELDFLSTSNTLVRVKQPGKYLLLPVEESNDDARIDVLVDGKLDKTINVRLAKNRTEYTVPFDLTPYEGHEVVLNIITSQGRSSVRESSQDACWKDITVSDTFDTTNREKYRPIYHHTPVWGWMNDPNGMFYKDGTWHLYYQWNPYGSKWQNLSWGHSTSKDLINWQDEGLALEPDGLGMIFSGSCAVDKNNTAGFGKDAVIALYTSAAASQIQSMAHSENDGKTFHKYAGNPVLPLDSEARDPNMFWNPETGKWNLLLAHALDHEMLIFSSDNLKEFTLESAFGKGLGAQDGVWECPDIFQLPVDGTNKKKWVLICNINPGGPFGGSGTQYFIGDFDGHKFTVDTETDGSVLTRWMDYGKDNYANVSFSDTPDGRRTIIGWMSNWQYAAEVPTKQFRSANTLPREVAIFTAPDGRLYMSNTPSPEVLALRGKCVKKVASANVGNKALKYNLPVENNGVCEIILDIDAATSGNVTLTLSNVKGEKVEMVYNPKAAEFSMDRRASGITSFSSEFPAVTTAPTHTADGKIGLRIFVDTSSIEAFEKDGRMAMTNLVFPTEPYTTLTVSAANGKAEIRDLQIFAIK